MGTCAIVGNSIGGALGLLLGLEHPDRVPKLVLVGSGGLGREVSLYVRLIALPLLGHILESSKVGGTRFMLYKVFHDHSFVTDELLEELYRSRQMPGAKEAVIRAIRRAVDIWGVRKEFVLTDRMRELRVPPLLVWGAEDQIVPVSYAYDAKRKAPEAQLRVFDRCGHWPHMERAAEFNSLVSEYLYR